MVISLNIIAKPIPKVVHNTSTTTITKKKNNKYERRRRKSAAAAIAKGKGSHKNNNKYTSLTIPKPIGTTTVQPKQQLKQQQEALLPTHDTIGDDECSNSDNNNDDDDNDINSSKKDVDQPNNESATTITETTHTTNMNITDGTCLDGIVDVSTISSKTELGQEQVHEQNHVNEVVKAHVVATSDVTDEATVSVNRNVTNRNKPIVLLPSTSSSTTATTNASQQLQLQQQQQQHAAYMAEFHARPMELDRRAGITTTTIITKQKNILNNNVDYDNTVNGISTNDSHNNNDDDNDDDTSEICWNTLPLHQRLLNATNQYISGSKSSSSSSSSSVAERDTITTNAVSRPTTIQCRAISLLLSQQSNHSTGSTNHYNTTLTKPNVFIHSETGSGKTLAYLLPILQNMMIVKNEDDNTTPTNTTSKSNEISRLEYGTRCVIICPTRELATQTTIVCERLCRLAGLMHIIPGCLGGASSSNSTNSKNNNKTIDSRSTEKVRLRKGLGIVIATPGRLLDHLKRTESLRTTVQKIQFMVLDEVDRLFDSGLGQQVQEIISTIQSLIIAPTSNYYIPWRSIFVSATITEQVQTLAKNMLRTNDDTNEDRSSNNNIKGHNLSLPSSSWVVVSGKNGNKKHSSLDANSQLGVDNKFNSTAQSSTDTTELYADSSPKQLIQMHVTCSAKLRLTALISFLLDRHKHNQTTVVFVSTCAAVDYYHTLLTSIDSILSLPTTNGKTSSEKGIFGTTCPIFKLHGNVPQTERQNVLDKFKSAAGIRTGGGSILLATDVAARGLNLPSVDWIVQFDVPCDVADYVHRAGRVARAGGVGHALLFLLPSEKDFLTVLQQRGVHNMTPMSLTLILNTAAEHCKEITQLGVIRGGGSRIVESTKDRNSSRMGEAFCIELQNRLEVFVIQDDMNTKALAKQEKKSKAKSKEVVSGKLIDMARDAFLSYIRAYPTKEKSIRHIFAAKALHLGHVARSFALKEPPKKVVAASQISRKRQNEKLDFSDDATSNQGNNKKKHLSFDAMESPKETNKRVRHTYVKPNPISSSDEHSKPTLNPKKGRSLLMANAVKLQSNGLDGL